MHRRHGVGARRRIWRRKRRRSEGLHNDIFDVLESAAFHPLDDESFKFRSMNFDGS